MRPRRKDWLTVTFSVAAAVLATEAGSAQPPAAGQAQQAPEPGPWRREGTDRPSRPDPYGGQIFCPVTGAKLGLAGPAVPVQTTLGAHQPSWLGKLFGQKPTPGAVIYVCCPACAERVRSNPQAYLTDLILDRGRFTFNYAQAPARRPPGIDPAPPAVAGKAAAQPIRPAGFRAD